MKKKPFVLSVIVTILATVVVSCEKDVNYGYSITMTTEASDVTFLVGAKMYNKIEIDWGDGIIEKYTPDIFNKKLKRENLGTSPKTITITGLVTSLICGTNQLTNLDVSKNTGLVTLGCGNNQLTNLDVSKNAALDHFLCLRNQLTNLDVSKNTELSELNCSNNQLTNLDVSKNTGLVTLGCGNNQLTNLDVSKNTGLVTLGCDNNQLTTAALNDLFDTLPGDPGSITYLSIFIGKNPGTNTCDRSIAENKRWHIFDN